MFTENISTDLCPEQKPVLITTGFPTHVKHNATYYLSGRPHSLETRAEFPYFVPWYSSRRWRSTKSSQSQQTLYTMTTILPDDPTSFEDASKLRATGILLDGSSSSWEKAVAGTRALITDVEHLKSLKAFANSSVQPRAAKAKAGEVSDGGKD